MPTIIDSLLITLGLDPKGFKEGAEEAERAQEKLKASATKDAEAVGSANTKAGASAQKVGKERATQANAEEKRQQQAERAAKSRQTDQKKRSDQTIQSLKTVGLYAAGAVLGFETLKGAVEAYAGASASLANTGRIAPTIGASVEELGSLSKALSIVSGKTEDATADIGKLGAAQTSVLLHAPDALAGWLRRQGVNLFDPSTGKQRDKVQVLKDIGDALRKQTSDVQTQANIARQMGLSEAAIQLFVVKTAAERDKILGMAEKENRATKEAAANAEKQAAAYQRIKNSVKGIGESIVGTVSPTVTKVLNAVADKMENAKPFKDPLSGLGLGGADKGRDYKGADAPYAARFAAAEKQYGLPKGLLAAVAKQESNLGATRIGHDKNGNVTGLGLMQLNPRYFKNAGKDDSADINTSAQELHTLYAKYRKMYGEKQAWALAIAHYNGGSRIDKGLKDGGKTQPRDETKSYVPRVLGNMERNAGFAAGASAPPAPTPSKPTAMNGGGGSVQIDQITINTQATDANGIAGTIAPALQRKGVVAQANGGLS